MTRAELGTKRVCPETGKKFYDLNKDPIVSPYTGKEYPRTFFEEPKATKPDKEKPEPPAAEPKPVAEAEDEIESTDASGPEFVSLEEADEDSDDKVDDDDEEAIPDIPDVEIEVEDDDDAQDDTFLEDEDEDDDLSDVIGDGVEGDEET